MIAPYGAWTDYLPTTQLTQVAAAVRDAWYGPPQATPGGMMSFAQTHAPQLYVPPAGAPQTFAPSGYEPSYLPQNNPYNAPVGAGNIGTAAAGGGLPPDPNMPVPWTQRPGTMIGAGIAGVMVLGLLIFGIAGRSKRRRRVS